MDDYPLHQVAETMRNVGTSDRNFYDRYYFNLHSSSDELFMVMGMGQYPTLGVQDAFAVVRRGDKHHVVRSSRELGLDRMDTSVGPLRIEVIEGLKKVRFIVEDQADYPIAMDVTWEGAIPAFEEPRQYIRRQGRVLFDSLRFAQTGYWSGSLRVGDENFEVTPDRWKGSRDRSWGIRPVGETEPPGIHQGTHVMEGMWNYAPMQFDDYSIIYICNEHNDGHRQLEEAVRVWNDPAREPDWLGRPEHEHNVVNKQAYTTFIDRSVIRFPEAPGGPLEVQVEPLTHVWVMVGTGYGLEADWKHGMYKGPLVTEHMTLDMKEDKERMFGLVDNAARFTLGEDVGYGLFEYGFFGSFDRYQIP
jgi:hypothetical protein